MTTSAGEHHVVDVRVEGGTGYPVVVGEGLRERVVELLERYAPAHRYALVSDTRVAELHGRALADFLNGAGVATRLFTFPEGEAHKVRKSWSVLSDELFEAGFGRDACVIALGGGVTGDLAGFVAATFMRGIPVVQVPTSLVAMVDASVGGKTGVDVRAGKNLVGAFHPPEVVVVDPAYVRTLPPEERSQGLAEAVKHGAVLDAAYFEEVAAMAGAVLAGDPRATGAVVRRSVELKARVVSDDEREGGIRKVLNFGHTLGHALEAESDYALPHGSAVAVGMVLEAQLGERLGVTEAGTVARIEEALRRCRLPVSPSGVDPRAVLERTRTDKKARGGAPEYVLPAEIGRVDGAAGWARPVPDEEVLAVLREAG